MKYKDYYAILGVPRDADEAAIKKAYRKLAHKYRPDVSKDPAGEEKFKAAAEAYATLKDKDKRTAYDQLGRYQPGEDFRPPPDRCAPLRACVRASNLTPVRSHSRSPTLSASACSRPRLARCGRSCHNQHHHHNRRRLCEPGCSGVGPALL